ncbi:BON domain-containing protein [Roseateles sp.]|uniref:BON domain-containing protein n=1 Tax=Roseateles sp. TaxID=1971397 RepID=UPI0039EB24ED
MLAALLLAGAADDEQVLNRFNDPFEAVSADIAGCPEPRGPRVTAAEARVQAHHRAERGTSCWLNGQCSEPNAYRFDGAIAAALRQALVADPALHPSSLWFTVQGRVVYLEGCVERAAQANDLEAIARSLPDVQQALALVRVGPGATLPYRRLP